MIGAADALPARAWTPLARRPLCPVQTEPRRLLAGNPWQAVLLRGFDQLNEPLRS
jgi:hypothetical protein